MEHLRTAAGTSNTEVRTCGVSGCRRCNNGQGICMLCVAAELAELTRCNTVLHGRVLQLEGALVTARAESVLLRRLLARAEELRAQDLVTLEQIEEACARQGYHCDSGEPVALWIEATLTRRDNGGGAA